jgi:hypothetical protein
LCATNPAPQQHRSIRRHGTREIRMEILGDEVEGVVSALLRKGNASRPSSLLHGGFAFGEDDWEMTKPYRDAGFQVLAPMLWRERAARQLPMFFDELSTTSPRPPTYRRRPAIMRADHLYVAGHSVGAYTHDPFAAM